MKKRYPPKPLRPIDDIRKDFTRRTGEDQSIGMNIEFFPMDGYLKGVDSLVFHTIGYWRLGLPEIVIYLGPRSNESRIPQNDAVSLSVGIMDALKKKETMDALVETRPLTFVTVGKAPRRFTFVPPSEELKERIRTNQLLNLSRYYDNYSYDLVVYEPAPWIH